MHRLGHTPPWRERSIVALHPPDYPLLHRTGSLTTPSAWAEKQVASSMNLSVILCTYNRALSLGPALESVALSRLPDGVSWEVLVIDNNSKDGTRAAVEAYCARYPGRFRYLFETRQGKSFALNTGLREAKGDVIAFMDDDVVVEPDWLQNLTAPLQGGSYQGTGGRICAPTDVTIPQWISLSGDCSLAGVLALFDRGSVPIELSDPPYGTNMAFHREMFEKFGAFRTDLGPCAGSEIRGEDTEFCLRLMKAGIPLLYVPTAVVHHEIPAGRMKQEYFLTWYFDYGRAHIRSRLRRTDDLWIIPRPLVGIMNHLAFMLPKKIFGWMFTFGEVERFFAKTQVWMIAGETAEIYNQWKADKQLPSKAESRPISQT